MAVDVGAFREAIFAGQQLIDLKKKFDDYDVKLPALQNTHSMTFRFFTS